MKAMDGLKIAGIVAAGVAAYWVVTSIAKKGAAGAGKAAGEAVANAAGGVIKGIGSAVGIPDTDLTQCNADLAAGRYWDASFSCPLPVYTKALINKAIGKETVNPSNVKTQAAALAPPPLPDTGAKGGQSSPGFAATDPRRLDLYVKVNPLADIQTQDFNAMGDFPINFDK